MLSDYYQNLSVISVNTEPLRNYYIPYASKEEAKQELERENEPVYRSQWYMGFSVLSFCPTVTGKFFSRGLY